MKKIYLCSLCAYKDSPECSRLERLVESTSPSSQSYLRLFKEFRSMCIRGQKWWTEKEKEEALEELEKLERISRERF